MTDEDYRVFKAFTDSFHESVASMTGLSVERLEVSEKGDKEGIEFLLISGFKGNVSGSMIVKSSAAAVLRLYEKYLGEQPPALNSDVLDGMKEFAGIVNGGASGKEQEMKLQFTPPLALVGDDVSANKSAKSIGLSVSYLVDQCGVFTIEIHRGKSS
ncbi:MAG: chemotaxis protein CheX [Lentisphaerales bacterium]|nr:chemotaxis protein CheX [Lentisphaerales bacterium]